MFRNYLKKSASPSTRASKLRLEALEDRQLLTATGWDAAPTVETAETADFAASNDVIDLSALMSNATTETPSTVVTTASDVVDDTDNLISLREAVEVYAETGSTITFDSTLTGETIYLEGTELSITKSLTIDGADLGITLNAGKSSEAESASKSHTNRVVNIAGEIVVALNGLTITGGLAEYDGGGIYATYGAAVTLTNSIVSGNTASEGGGICATECAAVTLTNSTVSGNNASYGGGICATYGAAATLTNSTVSGNNASYGGGGIYASDSSTATLTNSTVSGNTAKYFGGGIYAIDDSGVTLTSSTVSENTAKWTGGGISAVGETKLTLTNSTVSGNTADYGGGIYAVDSSVATLTNLIVSGNTASEGGGGIYASDYSMATLTNSTVSGNTAGSGGGIGASDFSEVTLKNSIVAANPESTSHADVYNENSDLYAYNVLSSYSSWDAGSDNLVYDSSKALFVDAENGDYSLTADSQAKDVGKNDYAAGIETDLAGWSRIAFDTVDLGAYEYHAALTSVAISGDAQVGETLTATVSPTDAEATWRWFRVDALGVETEIEGATEAAYVVQTDDRGFYLKAEATGAGDYSGIETATTETAVPVEVIALSAVHTGTSKPTVGTEIEAYLYVGGQKSTEATADFQWSRVDAQGAETLIEGATESTYAPTVEDVGYRIRVTAVGTGAYGGTVSVTHSRATEGIALSAVHTDTSNPTVGTPITATLYVDGVKSSEATADFQWSRVDAQGNETIIEGATESTYAPTDADAGYRLRVTAVGTGGYRGTVSVTHSRATRVALSAIHTSTSNPTVGTPITAILYVDGVKSSEATANFQWSRVDAQGKATKIEGATESTYAPTAEDVGYRLRVTAVGTDDYIGTVSVTHSRKTVAAESDAVLETAFASFDDEEFFEFDF